MRFSSVCVLADGRLTFRLLRESSYPLTDCECDVRCRVMRETSGLGIEGLVGAALLPLELDACTMLHLDVRLSCFSHASLTRLSCGVLHDLACP